jgi:hypothetical protein
MEYKHGKYEQKSTIKSEMKIIYILKRRFQNSLIIFVSLLYMYNVTLGNK